jgi:hypothetical protein
MAGGRNTPFATSSQSRSPLHLILRGPVLRWPTVLKRDILSYVEISSIPRDGLLFPSPKGKYLVGSWFARRIWNPGH